MTKGDTERLDWLSNHPSALGIKCECAYGPAELYHGIWKFHDTNEFTDIRALIDVAMGSNKRETK